MPSRDGVGVLSAPPEAGGPAAGAPLGCVGTSVFSKWDKLSPPSFWLLLLWMVLLSPTPQATSLPPALRAAPAWLMLPSCPLPWLMPCFWDHIPAGSQLGTFPMSHGGQHSHPCKIHPGRSRLSTQISSCFYVSSIINYLSFQVELRHVCLARCPQPGMRAVNFSLGSWSPSSLPALHPSERPDGDSRSPLGSSPWGPACP